MEFIKFLDFYDDMTDANELQGKIERLDAILCQNPFEIYSNRNFLIGYRFQKTTVRNLIDLVTETLQRPTIRHITIGPDTQRDK